MALVTGYMASKYDATQGVMRAKGHGSPLARERRPYPEASPGANAAQDKD
jgi:hypothetical protein